MSNTEISKPSDELTAPREESERIGEAVLKEAREYLIREATETGHFYAKELRISEQQFTKQLERSAERGESHVPEAEFEVWEKGVSDDWRKMQSAEIDMEDTMRKQATAEAKGEDAPLAEKAAMKAAVKERARIEAGMIPYSNPDDCDKTIEVQSGNFYFARMRKLIDAIVASGGDEKDLELAKSFPDAVAEHLRFKFTPRDELRDEFDTGNPTTTWQRVDEARNRAHNKSIETLNAINGLAEKYGTPRLTFRNFRTKGYLEELSSDEDAIAEYDRACVEGYYSIAFRSEVARLKAKQRRSSAYGLY